MADSRRLLRVAVLCCHTIPDEIANERGQFDKMFCTWLEAAVDARNAKARPDEQQVALDLKGYDIQEKAEYPSSLEEVDALIVSGSVASAYDDEPWIHRLAAFLQDVYHNHPSVKLFGGCFGHQIMAHALLRDQGVHVRKNPAGWEVGVHAVTVHPEFAAHFPGLLKAGQSPSVQLSHADHVTYEEVEQLPAGWIPLGTSPLCQVQGLLLPGRVLTYQGHPEFDSFINGQTTSLLANAGAVPKDKLEEFLGLVRRDDDRALWGEMALEFFLS